ncbi:hypothetical protein A4G99_04490 [Haladaptatus sp. R4]|uniref:hypothetical protein n=1 Tax=Haladaptatus sp. R4 TaxID=1679489 RepID=UPI0007B47F2A|nr:hypothetical protein [Haladaptatus sp. R4]KZN25710.1 hypothetical protein A4G99_04490 [Haladaptatus sp. R4]
MKAIKEAMLVLTVVVGALVVIPAVFFPKASCLTSGPHYHFCYVGGRITALVLVLGVVGLLFVTWEMDPE